MEWKRAALAALALAVSPVFVFADKRDCAVCQGKTPDIFSPSSLAPKGLMTELTADTIALSEAGSSELFLEEACQNVPANERAVRTMNARELDEEISAFKKELYGCYGKALVEGLDHLKNNLKSILEIGEGAGLALLDLDDMTGGIGRKALSFSPLGESLDDLEDELKEKGIDVPKSMVIRDTVRAIAKAYYGGDMIATAKGIGSGEVLSRFSEHGLENAMAIDAVIKRKFAEFRCRKVSIQLDYACKAMGIVASEALTMLVGIGDVKAVTEIPQVAKLLSRFSRAEKLRRSSVELSEVSRAGLASEFERLNGPAVRNLSDFVGVSTNKQQALREAKWLDVVDGNSKTGSKVFVDLDGRVYVEREKFVFELAEDSPVKTEIIDRYRAKVPPPLVKPLVGSEVTVVDSAGKPKPGWFGFDATDEELKIWADSLLMEHNNYGEYLHLRIKMRELIKVGRGKTLEFKKLEAEANRIFETSHANWAPAEWRELIRRKSAALIVDERGLVRGVECSSFTLFDAYSFKVGGAGFFRKYGYDSLKLAGLQKDQVAAVAKLPLKHLELRSFGMRPSDAAPAILRTNKKLVSLSLGQDVLSGSMSRDEFMQIAKAVGESGLESFSITAQSLDRPALRALLQNQKLTDLAFWGCRFDDEGFRFLVRVPRIKTLDLQAVTINRSAARALAGNRTLEKLTFDKNPQFIRPDDLRALKAGFGMNRLRLVNFEDKFPSFSEQLKDEFVREAKRLMEGWKIRMRRLRPKK